MICERVFATSIGAENDIAGLITISWVAMALIVAIDIPMLACQLGMVWKIQQFQDERHLRVEQYRAITPPSGINPFAALG